MKRIILLTMGLSMVTSIMAQEKKLFTLDDLLPGGRTYYQQSVPEQVFYTWWGDQLVKQEVDAVKTVDGEVLFTLNDINRILSAAGERQINYLLTVEFPYPDQTIAAVSEGDQYMMVDWTTKSVVESLKFEKGTENKDFAANSRCMAYTKEHNLKVVKADGKVIAVSNDGSLDLVYGESVHRNEFGINQGTFWSPSGQLLAFYKMDQSMVTSYPQVDI